MSQPDVKLACGHRVQTTVRKDSDTAWCPRCKRELFTGWPEHMEEKAATAKRLKAAVDSYLDDCIEHGVAPRLAAIINACESIVIGVGFQNGYRSGGAIDAD